MRISDWSSDVCSSDLKHPTELHLASDGPFGRFDRQQLQRGFQVYKEVCAACHSLDHVAIRSLADLGFSEPEVKALAKTRSEERRVGTEGVSTCRSRWSPYH